MIDSDALMDTYARLPVAFARGEGVWLWDEQGRRYLDALGGLAVCALGHAHAEVTRAIREQAGRLVHTSNLYGVSLQSELARGLTRLANMDRVFFCNSGAEANEAAIKIARAYASSTGVGLPEIVVVEGSFHGRTLATLSATGNPKIHAGFEPLVTGFVRVPFNDADAVAALASRHGGIVAVLVEPILGEGGVVIPEPGYLARLREICDRNGWLLMLDEVQTGLGRTGRWFAHQHDAIVPDVMTLAKALGNGVPIGACLARGAAASVLTPGAHGSTFGGNPLACSAALAVIGTMERESLPDTADAQGRRLVSRLAEALDGLNCVVEIRARGLMVGIELDRPCGELVGFALERKLLINVAAERVIRLLPALIINDAEIALLVDTLADTVRTWNAGAAEALGA